MTTFNVWFPGRKRVDAEFSGFSVRTDQPEASGGDGTAPSPFDLFLASVATCAGFYVKSYCDARNLPTLGLALTMQVERDSATHRVEQLRIEIALPAAFPDRHRDGVVRAAEQCAVKKVLQSPPEFEIRAVSESLEPAARG
jgi:putative redox protein